MRTFREFVETNDSNLDHEILSLYSNKESIRKIQEITGVSVGRVYRVLEKYGVSPSRRNKSDLHELIRQYHGAGTNINKISELTGYTKRHIRNIIY